MVKLAELDGADSKGSANPKFNDKLWSELTYHEVPQGFSSIPISRLGLFGGVPIWEDAESCRSVA